MGVVVEVVAHRGSSMRGGRRRMLMVLGQLMSFHCKKCSAEKMAAGRISPS